MLTTLSCETCFNEKSVINYFGRYVMIQRESTSLTFFFLIPLALVLFCFIPLICSVVETDQMRSSTFHVIRSLMGTAKKSCSVESVPGITPSS